MSRLQAHEQRRKLRTSEAGCDESRTPRFNREVPRIIPGIDSTDPNKAADYHYDATLSQSWDSFPECEWICTNPPYAEFAAPIIKNAYQKARVGVAAFLLTSFLEPCDDRAEFLQEHPPSLVIIMPRFCFRKDKRGTRWATDNVTISCFVWDKRAIGQQIIIRPKSAIAGFYKNPEQAISQERAEKIVRAIAKGELCNN
ncbi:hypothetical protein ACWATR_32000 [Nostoc sp. UIC 10890]